VNNRPDSYELETGLPRPPIARKPRSSKLPFRRIFTRNVLNVLTSHAFLALHVSTFNSLFSVYLSAKVYDPADPVPSTLTRPHLPFSFTGGLGWHPTRIGIALAVLGGIGIALQLLAYPALHARLGSLGSYRLFLVFFPLAYCLMPYLSTIPSSKPPPGEASGALLWLGVLVVLAIQVTGRTFALPSNILLVNNCSPHPSVLGTVHGIAQSVSSLSRSVGPIVGTYGFGKCLETGVVGGVFWSLGIVALLGWGIAWRVREGDGHEIWLENDGNDMEPEKEVMEAKERKGRESVGSDRLGDGGGPSRPTS